jgi:transcriptional regulator with XRE-family HTH domain
LQEPSTWRELLSKVIQDPQERHRIATELGINSATLVRWAHNETNPRQQNLLQLLTAISHQYQTLFFELVEEEFPAVLRDGSVTSEPLSIPSEFYTRVFHTHGTVPKALRFSSMCDLILQQALEQLDPNRVGIAIIVARCLSTPHRNNIRSLRESAGRGTPPWESNLEQYAILLGAESLAGYAVSFFHLIVNQNLREDQSRLPGYRGEGEESAAAWPIVLEGKIAGSLLVSSTQPNYFLPSRITLIESYAELITLAFEPEEFYEPQRIELGIVPPQHVQQPYLSMFRQRFLETMNQAARNQHPISPNQAEQMVWQQLEEDLLQVAAHLER